MELKLFGGKKSKGSKSYKSRSGKKTRKSAKRSLRKKQRSTKKRGPIRRRAGNDGWVNCGYRNAQICAHKGYSRYCTPSECDKWLVN